MIITVTINCGVEVNKMQKQNQLKLLMKRLLQ